MATSPMWTTRTARVAVLVMIAACTTATTLAGSAAADEQSEGVVGDGTSHQLTLSGFSDIVVDERRDRVFVSGGRIGGPLVVTDADGRQLRALSELDGAAGLLLAPDADTLYAALPMRSAIAEIDLVSMTHVLRPTGADTCPTNLAWSADTVWWGGRCPDFRLNGVFGSLDPSTGRSVQHVLEGYSNDHLEGPPMLFSDPSRPDELLLGETLTSDDSLLRLRVSGGASPDATVLAEHDPEGTLDSALWVDDGQYVVVASGPRHHRRLDADTLEPAGSYQSAYHTSGVAARSDGLLALSVSHQFDPDVYLYNPGATEAAHRRVVHLGLFELAYDDGVAFGNGRLYVAAENIDVSGRPTTLTVLDPGTPEPVQLDAATDRPSYFWGEDARIAVEASPEAVGGTVTLRRWGTPNGIGEVVHRWTVDSTRVMTADVEVAPLTHYGVRFEYPDGTSTPTEWLEYESGPAPAPVSVETTLTSPDRRVDRWSVYRPGRTARVQARVLGADAPDAVAFVVQHRSAGGWRTLRTVTKPTDDRGKAYLAVRDERVPGRAFRVRATATSPDAPAAQSALDYGRHRN